MERAIDWAQERTSDRARVLDVLSDRCWHGNGELARICNRYGARILELKREGWDIEAEPLPGAQGNRFRLVSSKKGPPVKTRKVRIYLEESDARELAAGRLTLFARHEIAEALSRLEANRGKL
jgi:hypothetical protein